MSKKKLAFPKSAEAFLSRLKKNNTKEWFQDHKPEFESDVLDPARDFVLRYGSMLKDIVPELVVEPRINGSIFKLHRDTRFSTNKQPYKTNLGMYFWDHRLSKMDSPGFYVHIEPGLFFCAAGVYQFSKEYLKVYRNIVSHKAEAQRFTDVIVQLSDVPGITVHGKTLKRGPLNHQLEEFNKDLLLYTALYADSSGTDYSVFDTVDPAEYFFEKTLPMLDLFELLRETVFRKRNSA